MITFSKHCSNDNVMLLTKHKTKQNNVFDKAMFSRVFCSIRWYNGHHRTANDQEATVSSCSADA